MIAFDKYIKQRIISDEQRIIAFTLSVGNSPDVNEHTQCASHNGAVAAGATVNESCMATGRYLSFRVTGENETLTLCEVVVIGHKYVCTYQFLILFLSVNFRTANTKRLTSNAFEGIISDQFDTY